MARMVHSGEDPATAVAAARVALDAPSAGPFRLWWGDDLGVCMESHAHPRGSTVCASAATEVRRISAFDPTGVGCAQVIAVVTDPATAQRSYLGAADPRGANGATASR